MVKRQNERLYESSREHRERMGGGGKPAITAKPLPFSHCALSLTAYTHPVTTKKSQLLFDRSHLVPFILKHKADPVTGVSMTIKDIITLNMSQDEEGNWQCPVTGKPFNDLSKIIGIRQSNDEPTSVYSYAAYQQFNVRAKQYEDLVTGIQFDPAKDVMVLFDPERRADIQTFHHIRNARALQQQNVAAASSNVRHTLATTRVMEKIQQRQSEQKSALARLKGASKTDTSSAPEKLAYFRSSDGSKLNVLSSDVTGVVYTDATTTSSLMSTAVGMKSKNAERPATVKEITDALYRRVRQQRRKGYVKLHISTLSSPLVVELHCDVVPMTCDNFLGLCREGKYDSTTFHRLISQFMIQGGKPTSPAIEDSYWENGPFRDEFDDRLQHTGSGILSMANAGPHTNKCQFFITFKSSPHLDRKHSIFGTVINENKDDLLRSLQSLSTDSKDRPVQPVFLQMTEIVEDPIADAREKERNRLEAIIDQREGRQSTAHEEKPKGTDSAAVGKYLKLAPTKISSEGVAVSVPAKEPQQSAVMKSSSPQPTKKQKFGNFNKW